MTTEPTYFRDGYTRRCRIKGVERLYGELNFELRPMLAVERDRLSRIAKQEHPDRINAAAFEAIARHVVAWDAHDEEGRQVPVSRENVARLAPSLYDRLYRVMVGWDAGDPPEGATDEESDDWLARLDGADVARHDEKNWSAGSA